MWWRVNMKTEVTLGKIPFLNCITLHGWTSSLFLKTLPSAESDLITSCPSQHSFLCRRHGCAPHLETQGNDKGSYCPWRASGWVYNLGFRGQTLPLFRRISYAQNEQMIWHRGVCIRVECPQKIFFFGWVKFNLSGLRPFTLEDTTRNQELSNCPYTKGREGARPFSFLKSQCSKLCCIRWQSMGFSRKFFFFLFCL